MEFHPDVQLRHAQKQSEMKWNRINPDPDLSGGS